MTKEHYTPDRGDVIWFNRGELKDPIGTYGAAVVLSSKQRILKTGEAMVCPITSDIRDLAIEVPIYNLDKDYVAISSRIETYNISARNVKKMTQVDTDTLKRMLTNMVVFIGAYEILDL